MKPTDKQLSFMDWELGLFLHFGIRTFYEGHEDWDGKFMPPAGFRPTALDCSQWLATAQAAGCKYAVFTAKHHDGFALWPTRYSDYSVSASPWKDGMGDVVREYVEACRQYKIKVGLYYSPADDTVNKQGWTADSYDEFFLRQVSELLTQYGTVDVLWFDGCGSENHAYDWPRIVKEIRRLQPGILLFNMGDPDIRWIGNEAGIAPLFNWNEADALRSSIRTDRADALNGGSRWLPGECDCRIRQDRWFYSEHDGHTVKSVGELMGLYDYSVGRGANLLINIGPDRRGLLPEEDAGRLLAFGEAVRRRFSRPIAGMRQFRIREGEAGTTEYVYAADDPFLLDHAVLTEPLQEGQSVKRFEIGIMPYPYGEEIAVYAGRTVGHKAICRFPVIRTREVVVRILDRVLPHGLSDIQLYHAEGTP